MNELCKTRTFEVKGIYPKPFKPVNQSLIGMVCKAFFIGEDRLLDEGKTAHQARARAAYAHIAKHELGMSSPGIGTILNRHHSTVNNLWRIADELMFTNEGFRARVNEIIKVLREKNFA